MNSHDEKKQRFSEWCDEAFKSMVNNHPQLLLLPCQEAIKLACESMFYRGFGQGIRTAARVVGHNLTGDDLVMFDHEVQADAYGGRAAGDDPSRGSMASDDGGDRDCGIDCT